MVTTPTAGSTAETVPVPPPKRISTGMTSSACPSCRAIATLGSTPELVTSRPSTSGTGMANYRCLLNQWMPTITKLIMPTVTKALGSGTAAAEIASLIVMSRDAFIGSCT